MTKGQQDAFALEDYSQERGPTLTFSNLHYCIPESNWCRKKHPEKYILKDVSGIMRPGMNAIMGATGSGKTSLLDVIAGRKDPAGLRQGSVLVDGKVVTSKLRLSSAYVVQDDILMGTLSVRENLRFSANLRLDPRRHSSADKRQRVDTLLDELGLNDCADTKIGTEFLRGVSGGERKRCSIGMELITSPTLLFLDEPTTGLDSNTANCIIGLLHELSRRGKTVIFSIHQPRFSIFRRFDHLTLMHKGEVVYAGAAHQTLQYFTDLGYQIESFDNPADFFMDITNGEAKSSLEEVNTSERKNILAVKYYQSQLCQDTLRHLDCINRAVSDRVKVQEEVDDYATSFLYQLRVVCGRTVLNTLRNPQTSYAQLALTIFFAVLVGLIYFQMPLTLPEALQNRTGAFFFLIINMVFGNLSAVELFINERAIFIHENSSGYYRTSVYFLSKIFADLIPNRIIPIFAFSVIAYYMMGLKSALTAFLRFALTMSMVSLAGVSLAFLVSASVSSFAMANIFIALPFVFMMVFGGYLVNLNAMLSWLSWLKWISIFRYGLNAAFINEMAGQLFYTNTTTIPGELFLWTQDIDYSAWGFWQNQVALLGIIVVCMTLAYVQLRRINRWNSKKGAAAGSRRQRQTVQCPGPPHLPNGTVSCGDDAATRFSYGNNCTFRCDSGYQMKGPQSVTCTLTGQWSEMPHCEAIPCTAPEAPKNGHMNCTPSLLPSRSPFPHDSVCTFGCQDGFELQGGVSMACTHSGEWNAAPPTCQESASQLSAIVAGATIGGVVALSALSLLVWILRRRRRAPADHLVMIIMSSIEDPPPGY